MSKLYELADQYRKLAATLEEYDLEPATLLDTLDSSNELMAIEEKAANIVRMTKNWESDLPGLDAEIKRLTERKKAIENRVKSVKTYLQGCMESAGLEKIKVDTFNISLQNNPPSLNVVDLNAIPAEFITVIPEQHQPDKARIKAALKEGREVPGVTLEVGKSLRIR